MQKKIIKTSLPLPVWEEFYSLYPDRNERSLVLQRLIMVLIDLSQDHTTIIEKVHQRLEEERDAEEDILCNL